MFACKYLHRLCIITAHIAIVTTQQQTQCIVVGWLNFNWYIHGNSRIGWRWFQQLPHGDVSMARISHWRAVTHGSAGL